MLHQLPTLYSFKGQLIMNNELKKTEKDSVVTYLKALFQNFSGGTEEDHEYPQASKPHG
jgi:hypothetical protein